MSSRRPVEGLPEGALEVAHKETGEVVGWVWPERPAAHPDREHWRFATAIERKDGTVTAYASPFGFLERQYAFARVAVVKGIVSHHLRVQGDQ